MKSDLPASKECRAFKESAVRKARTAEQEPLAHKACPVFRECTVPQVLMGPWGLPVETEETEPRVSRNLFPRAFGSPAGRLAARCKMERTANRVRWGLLVPTERKVWPVHGEFLVQMEPSDPKDHRVNLVCPDVMDVMDCRVSLVHRAFLVSQVFQDQWDLTGQKVNPDRKVLWVRRVLLVLLDLQARRDYKVLRGFRVNVARLGLQGWSAPKERKASRETAVLKEQLARWG